MLGKERQWIFEHTMQVLDKRYDKEAALLGSPRGHGVRDSAHYALGLLERGAKGDREQALRVIEAILKLQYKEGPDDAFYGTFKRTDKEADPPHVQFPGAHFDGWARYDLDVWQEKIGNDLRLALIERDFTAEQRACIAREMKRAILKNVPIIWESYDPNWREFIASTFSLILARHEKELSAALTGEIAKAMERAVSGSIERYDRGIHPMNTNVELMHIFICDFYGSYLKRGDFTARARLDAEAFVRDFNEFGTVAEYNSPTYYCVDFVALSMWRQMAPSAQIRAYGAQLEAALWREVAENYHPGLYNVCGPFSRSYEMDMRLHTSLPSLLYITLGEEQAPQPEDNYETAGGIDLALLGTCVPEDAKEKLRTFSGEHSVKRRFKELIERGAPNANRPICDTSAYLAKDYMLGAAKGSHNTSGQLRAAVAYWLTPEGKRAYMTLLRRAPGEHYNSHYRTIFIDAQVEKNKMEIDVRFDVQRDIELYFEIDCPGMRAEQITPECFALPGMTIRVKADAPTPRVRRNGGVLEVIYACAARDEEKRMRFNLTFDKA